MIINYNNKEYGASIETHQKSQEQWVAYDDLQYTILSKKPHCQDPTGIRLPTFHDY